MPFTDAVKGTTVKVNLKGGTDVKIPAGKHLHPQHFKVASIKLSYLLQEPFCWWAMHFIIVADLYKSAGSPGGTCPWMPT